MGSRGMAYPLPGAICWIISGLTTPPSLEEELLLCSVPFRDLITSMQSLMRLWQKKMVMNKMMRMSKMVNSDEVMFLVRVRERSSRVAVSTKKEGIRRG